MEITNKQALEAAETLKNYCGLQDCQKCPFVRNKHCEFKTGGPYNWIIPTVPRWTKTDKALAEALKLAGVKTIFRKEGKLWLANGFYSMVDSSGIIDVFHDLLPGESISLEEIVNSKGEREND